MTARLKSFICWRSYAIAGLRAARKRYWARDSLWTGPAPGLVGFLCAEDGGLATKVVPCPASGRITTPIVGGCHLERRHPAHFTVDLQDRPERPRFRPVRQHSEIPQYPAIYSDF